jgi:hypothetical protein
MMPNVTVNMAGFLVHWTIPEGGSHHYMCKQGPALPRGSCWAWHEEIPTSRRRFRWDSARFLSTSETPKKKPRGGQLARRVSRFNGPLPPYDRRGLFARLKDLWSWGQIIGAGRGSCARSCRSACG